MPGLFWCCAGNGGLGELGAETAIRAVAFFLSRAGLIVAMAMLLESGQNHQQEPCRHRDDSAPE